MAKYDIFYRKAFRKKYKKLNDNEKKLIREVVDMLSNGETLAPKYNNHKLKGEFKNYMECHIKPDLLLVYEIKNDILVLICIDVGSHSDLFK